MTSVTGWESLIVNTKVSILVALGALGLPLCEIKESDFQDYYCSNSENENTLANETRKCFTEAATKTYSSNLCLATIIRLI